ncbi:TolC family protein [bacterium]|nr:TolC family protein [bacterium]
MRRPTQRSISRSSIVALTSALATLSACQTYEPVPLRKDRLASGVGARSPSSEAVRAALAELAAFPLKLEAPSAPSTDALDGDAVWAVSIAYAAETHAAVREVEAALARTRTARVVPRPVLMGDATGLERDDVMSEVNLTFDLLTLLRVGRKAGEIEVADAGVVERLGNLEHIVWTARFDIRRDLAEIAMSRSKVSTLEAGNAELEEWFARRAEGLHAKGWLSADAWGSFEGRRSGTRVALERARVELLAAEIGLKQRVGLPPETAVSFVTSFTPVLVVTHAEHPSELLGVRPDLRHYAFGYAVRDAELRTEVLKQYPGIQIGTRAVFTGGSWMPGGIVQLDVPLWNVQGGPIAEARAHREQARQALEDGLSRALGELASARARVDEARARGEHLKIAVIPAAERGARGMRVRWLAGRESLELALSSWQMALDARLALAEAERDLARAEADLAQAAGVQP